MFEPPQPELYYPPPALSRIASVMHYGLTSARESGSTVALEIGISLSVSRVAAGALRGSIPNLRTLINCLGFEIDSYSEDILDWNNQVGVRTLEKQVSVQVSIFFGVDQDAEIGVAAFYNYLSALVRVSD